MLYVELRGVDVVDVAVLGALGEVRAEVVVGVDGGAGAVVAALLGAVVVRVDFVAGDGGEYVVPIATAGVATEVVYVGASAHAQYIYGERYG